MSGSVLVEQSMLTGESVPIDAEAGAQIHAGSLIRRGEAIARVTATGPRTYFGRAAEPVRVASVASTEHRAILGVVRNLAVVNGAIALVIVVYAHAIGLPPADLVGLALTARLASIPVALLATFTLWAAIGARTLGRRGVLLTRLSAIDSTIRRAAAPIQEMAAPGRLVRFAPFDPATRISEALAIDHDGSELRVAKGAFQAIATVADVRADAQGRADELAELIGFGDPPREDSADLIGALREMGVRTVMVTGDSAVTAAAIAAKVGIAGAVCPRDRLPNGSGETSSGSLLASCRRRSTAS